MPIQIDLVPLLVGLIGAVGGGAGLVKLIDGLVKIRAGMSATENGRRIDIVKQRDAAISYGDNEAEKKRLALEYASQLRRQLFEAGVTPLPEPVFERTLTRAQLAELREQEK